MKTIDDYCHSKGIAFILADVYGAFAWLFVDFGVNFEVCDKNGEENIEMLVANITQVMLILLTPIAVVLVTFGGGQRRSCDWSRKSPAWSGGW